jgi:transcriptional regulator with GAF, ATPase, and Fis domain
MFNSSVISRPGAALARPGETPLLGRSEAILRILEDIDCAARSDAKVLVTGETGVGKEVVARLIHHRSARASAPLVTLNCAGLPDSLLESELFGHMRGSFTGAYRDKPGLLETAPNGTVFLDEVGEMSMRMQLVLLRFLETGEIQRIGSDRPRTRVNVRIITATNRDLRTQIASGEFREDLFFRLNVIRVTIPPLRERLEDIPLLVNHYVDAYSGQHRVARPEVSTEVMGLLTGHAWPGNVRELKNVVERMVLKANGQTIRPTDLPADVFRSLGSRGSSTAIGSAHAGQPSLADTLVARMLEQRESFWSAVYPMFMSRDMTRDDLRKIVEIGLQNTSGNYRLLTQLFNMPESNYKRFLSFLRKHECHLPFQRFRVAPGPASPSGHRAPVEPAAREAAEVALPGRSIFTRAPGS